MSDPSATRSPVSGWAPKWLGLVSAVMLVTGVGLLFYDQSQTASGLTLMIAGLALAVLAWASLQLLRARGVTPDTPLPTPETVRSYPLEELPKLDQALTQAKRRGTTLTLANIPERRWEQAVAAGHSLDAALQHTAEALGATPGPRLVHDPHSGDDLFRLPSRCKATALRLPELRLRFERDTVLAAIDGDGLEDGPARALIEAIHRDGRGPRQALVLDLTVAQDARARLALLGSVQTVTLSADQIRDLLLADEPMEHFESALVAQIPVIELSPYQVAGGVEQDSLFFGRDQELRLMAGRSLRSFVLVGARQMGKTSLLKALARRFADRRVAVVHYLSLDRSGDIVGNMARALASDDHDKPAADAKDTPLAAQFRALAAGSRERPRLWLIDEADMFVRADAERQHAITDVMRQLTNEGRAFFVLAGYWELYAATTFDYQHPLLNFAERVQLDPLDPDAARRLATEPLAALGLRWDSDESITHLIEGSGCRANLIVLACKGLIYRLDRETRVLTRDHLDRVVLRDRDLGDALRADRRLSTLDRAVVYQTLALDRPRFDDVMRALRDEHDVRAPMSAFEHSRERVLLAYMLVEDDHGRLSCPVPFMDQRLRRIGDLSEHAHALAAEWRASQAAPT
ncbi:MAG: hypothetical protein Tsb0020_54970 [Haliangiales bacterium]